MNARGCWLRKQHLTERKLSVSLTAKLESGAMNERESVELNLMSSISASLPNEFEFCFRIVPKEENRSSPNTLA